MNGEGMYKDWTDEKLDEHRILILMEQERRANLAAIPEQIAEMARVYRDGGGDEDRLQEALTPEEREALRREPAH